MEAGTSVDLAISADEDMPEGAAATLRLAGYHIENEETDRAFHTRLRAVLSWRQVAHLQRFIACLLESRE